MLSVFLCWIYVTSTTLVLGYAFSSFCGKVFHYKLHRLDNILFTGLVIATVYAQVWSLFFKVGLIANIVLLLFCIFVILIKRKDFFAQITNIYGNSKMVNRIMVLILFILWSYLSSRGYMTYDSDLYHAQSIRWIEEFGIVKGLGNLHCRFAYNSSSFALSALYSMKFLGVQSLHTLSGFFAFLLSISVLDITKAWKNRKMKLSDYAKVAAIYYLTTVSDEIVAPASDYFIMCTIFFIMIKWLNQLETEEEKNNVIPYALLCVAGVYALTLKLTAGLILLLLIKPAFMLIKQKQVKNILLFLLLGLIVAVPWFSRTVIISGWLFYPLPQLDLFDVDWKMNAEAIAVDAAEIKTWARALYSAALVNKPVTEWFFNWFLTQLTILQKVMILGDIASSIVYVVVLSVMVLRKKWHDADHLLVLGTILLSYLFWQFSAPMIRYGYAYVLLLCLLMSGFLLQNLKKDGFIRSVIAIYGIYKAVTILIYVFQSASMPYYLRQEDYGSYEYETYEIDGIAISYPVNDDRIGYDSFPASPYIQDIELRGDNLRDGFRQK